MKYSFPKEKISILLLEDVHPKAIEELKKCGYSNIETYSKAMTEDELIDKIKNVHILGIRSRTNVTKKVLDAANKLFCIGCFCIGTNQVDVDYARKLGIPVFNAPFSNTRSVAELVLAEIIMLMRGVHEKSLLLHNGGWSKSAKGSYEVRNKTLGIIGYGRIGSQLSILAESLGMKVIFYDIVKKLSLGNSKSCSSLYEVLQDSDVVSLHVPDTVETKNMIRYKELSFMKPGSYLINASRGSVVDIDDLAKALKNKHIAGAAIDVFPDEPTGNAEEFVSPLRGINNAILTPHIGGSTIEAQENIGLEVTSKFIDFSDVGSTIGSVNFVQVSLPVHNNSTRFLHIHKNVPGVLAKINDMLVDTGLNIVGQYLQTDSEVGYVVVDVGGDFDRKSFRSKLENINGTIRVRFLY